MRTPGRLASLLLLPLLLGAPSAPAEGPPDPDRLVKALGSDDWQVRDEAETALERLGLPARPHLEAALKSTDEETVWRARKILARITRTRLTVALETPDGKPAAGVRTSLNLLRQSPPGVGTPIEAKADPEGIIRVWDRGGDAPFLLDPGDYMVQIAAEGFLPVKVEPLRLDGGERTLAWRLERGARVSGTLRFEDGTPAEGVALGLFPCLEPAQIHRYAEIGNRREAVADAEGRFAFEAAPEGHYRLVAEAKVQGCLARILVRRVILLRDGQDVKDLALSLPDDAAGIPHLIREALLTGTCVDPSGKPLAGRLRFFLDGLPGWPEHADEVKTDAGGRFAALVPPGRHWLSAALPQTAPTTLGPVTLAPGANPPVTLVLTPGARLSGVAVDADGAPVPLAEIAHYHPGRLEAGTPETSMNHQIVFADKLGRFEIPNAMPGTWELRATAEGKGLGPSRTFRMKEGDSEEVRLEVTRGIRVTGRVSAADGTPIEHAEIQAHAEAWDNHAGDPWEPYAGASGESFAGGEMDLTLPVPGRWWITARKAGFRNAAILAESKRDGDRLDALEIRLDPAPPGRLRIKASDSEGRPVPNAHVQVLALHPLRAPLRTDARGEAVLDDLPPASYTVAVTKPGYAAAFETAEVAEGREASVAAVLLPGCSLTGRVTGPDGKGLAGYPVWAWRAEFSIRHTEEQFGTASWETTTDAEGRYRFEHLPKGRLKIAPAPGALPCPMWIGATPPGRTEAPGPDFALLPGIPLTVRVADPDGRPVANASVEVYPEKALTDPYSVDLHAVVFTDPEGVARIPPLPPGAPVELLVNHPDWAWVYRQGLTVPGEGTMEQSFRLEPGVPCLGAVKCLAPAHPGDLLQEDVFILALGPGAAKARVRGDGTFSLDRLLPGDYRVFLTVGNRAMAGNALTVLPGKPARLEIPLAKRLPVIDY